eukprot:TRINITY_DN80949_c0_g1_i1.p1 TRINITY_DN80949_c0_g1~~TRINITY_DN80949_c0_g1_i1.p1  ORF type:complete len:237 (-),score=49.53 TRINITY_DN80949_c0_g1_i1:107-817(-)
MGISQRHLAASTAAVTFSAALALAWRRRQRRQASAVFELPTWLRWLEECSQHYRVSMREWEDEEWRRESGWQGSDYVHSASSAVHVPCYFYNPSEKTLRGPVVFRRGSESHRGLCHGGAMTSALDDVLGHVAFLAAGMGPWSGATVQVNVKLKKPVRIGQTLLLEGRVTKQDRRKVFVEATLLDEQGHVYASMDGLSIVGAKMQEEESHLDRREWQFDEVSKTVVDSPREQVAFGG